MAHYHISQDFFFLMLFTLPPISEGDSCLTAVPCTQTTSTVNIGGARASHGRTDCLCLDEWQG